MNKLRKLFRISNEEIDEEMALQIAKAECEKQDWSWIEPVKVVKHFNSFEVITNSRGKGTSARIIVGRKSGEIKKTGFLRR